MTKIGRDETATQLLEASAVRVDGASLLFTVVKGAKSYRGQAQQHNKSPSGAKNIAPTQLRSEKIKIRE